MSNKEQRGLLEANKYGGLAQEIAALLSQPKPAPALLTDGEIDAFYLVKSTWRNMFRAIDTAALKKNGLL